jgi:hypothetical protein
MHDVMDWRNIKDPTEKLQAYYASREWGLKKVAVRNRANGICERCKVNAMDHVHHLTYIRKFNEELTDLQAICRPCHDFTHAKSDVDPAAPGPVMCCGKPISSVYLAGTCEPTTVEVTPEGKKDNWRRDLTWAYFVGHHKAPPGDHPQFITLADGRKLAYAGPHIYYQHNYCIENNHGESGSDAFVNACAGISKADLVFAWVDRLDCFGTIAEIGAAHKQRVVVVAGPKRFDELWFVYRMADLTIFDKPDPRPAMELALSVRIATP